LNADPAIAAATRRLLGRIGLALSDVSADLRVTGCDPVLASRLRYGTAVASALAAHGAAVATLWCRRSGVRQQVDVDLSRAVHLGLRTTFVLRQNGYGFAVGSLSRAENYFETADGRHIYLLRNNGRGTITQDLVGLLRCPNSTAGIAEAVRQHSAFELEEALAEARLPGVVARTPQEWCIHPQGRLLADEPAVGIHRIGDAPPRRWPSGTRPLAGLRVLDASHVIAGPALGRLLAEQGADVLHVTNPAERETPAVIMDMGFGKRAAYLDLNRESDAAQMRRLVSQCDVFIDSFRPGALQGRGFGPHDLAAIRPGIVCVSISAYGFDGPWRCRGGYEPIGQAVSGLGVREGWPGPPRAAPTATMNDYLCAYLAGAGVVGALLQQSVVGGSHHVTTSLAQASMWVLSQGELGEVPLADDLAPWSPQSGDLLRTMSVFGELQHAAPIARFSATPGYWSLPPTPPGSSAALW
jgi:crotonobetainyl-CoA:carnitine CoA-transferase CaiB-like acyl-CoA transferase